jgi:phage baseplate assembly protein W
MNSNLYNKIALHPASNTTTISQQMYKGFSTVSNNTENFNLFDYELIQQDLLNHFFTRQGERLMNPTFGTIIWDLLFEPLTDDLRVAITQNVNEILNYDPRISANQVIVTSYDTGIQIDCLVTYLPYNVSQSMRLSFDQNNGLVVG